MLLPSEMPYDGLSADQVRIASNLQEKIYVILQRSKVQRIRPFKGVSDLYFITKEKKHLLLKF
ncbi:hypothetical protein BX666DRAFT_1908044 [Dichotomocladium elegans]|nr:hypothetical protein BX666DRAFT_1908044 [Dichotomocladium elegans]